jgi:hypothetical protein
VDYASEIPFEVVAITIAVVLGVIVLGVILVNVRAKKMQHD